MYHRCYEFLKVDDSVIITADICFGKYRAYDGTKYTETRRWYEPKHQKDLLRILQEAVALYRLVRQEPEQLKGLLKCREATVRTCGALQIAYIFKRTSAPCRFILETCPDSLRDRNYDGGQFRNLHVDDVFIACSVALIGVDGEEAGLGRLVKPIGADFQPTVSSYFKSTSGDP